MHELERRRSGLGGLGWAGSGLDGRWSIGLGRIWGCALGVARGTGATRAWVRRSSEVARLGLTGRGRREGKEEGNREK